MIVILRFTRHSSRCERLTGVLRQPLHREHLHSHLAVPLATLHTLTVAAVLMLSEMRRGRMTLIGTTSRIPTMSDFSIFSCLFGI